MYPLPANHKKGEGLHRLKASEINTIENMLNDLVIEMVLGQDYAEVIPPPGQDGKGWKFKIPSGGGLPSNANKSKWMVPTMSADNATATDDPSLWTVDWVRAHA